MKFDLVYNIKNFISCREAGESLSLRKSMNMSDDLDDECNQLLLELSVRKEIVNDTKNKVGNILG